MTNLQQRLDELAEQLSRREGEVVDYPRLQKELKNAREQVETLKKLIKEKLQANLGLDYCNWTESLDKILDKVSQDASDNFWKERIEELEDQIHLSQQAHNHELRSQIQANQAKDQIIEKLQQNHQNHLSQEKSQLTQEIQLIKEALHD